MMKELGMKTMRTKIWKEAVELSSALLMVYMFHEMAELDYAGNIVTSVFYFYSNFEKRVAYRFKPVSLVASMSITFR